MTENPAAPKVIATWVGALTQGGVLLSDAEAGKKVAALFVGEDVVARLRKHFADAPAALVRRERKAAVETCIWMAAADRVVTKEERTLLLDIVKGSGLPEDDRISLAVGIDDPPPLSDVDKRIESPELRELLLALAWELALADGVLHRHEQAFLDGLIKRFAVAPARAAEIVSAVQGTIPK
jgi:uncharacterized membrane protein YebE (DUF533 family)